ncbi:MAG: DnaJ domain-containing protein [Spirochaetes bacterium]|nr:DnaJ domain-containing protein [Spirochaetota bacterium]
MQDYYKVLGVSRQASSREIKSSFRRKAKIHHPDTADGNDETARLLIEAYRTLLDPQLRREYDRKYFMRFHDQEQTGRFEYRSWLKERLEHEEYKAKLVFYDLLHGFEDEALALYDSLQTTATGRMERFFERPEAMDAEFCIAEEYIKRSRYVDAYRVLCKLIRMEQLKPGFGYFYEVVLDEFRRLVLDILPNLLTEEAYLALLDEAIDLQSSSLNSAWFYRRKSEIFSRKKEPFWAERFMQAAIRLHPAFAKVSSLRKKAGL